MSRHLLDKPIMLAQCRRCSAYVFLGVIGGLRVAADPAPLDANGYRAALGAGRLTFDQGDQGGRPKRLSVRTAASEWPPPGNVLGEHACGGRSMDTDAVEVVETVPKAHAPNGAATSPASPTCSSAPDAWAETAMATAATPATSQSSRPVTCAVCHKAIRPDLGELYWGIDGFKETEYFQHTGCE